MRQLGEQWVVKQDDGRNHLIEKVDAKEGHYKDLGPVNEQGCLAEERTGLFPTITKVTDGIWKASVYHNGGLMQIEIEVWATTQQQVIYAWNRRT